MSHPTGFFILYVDLLSTAALFFYGRHRIHVLAEMSNTIYKFMFKLTSAFHILYSTLVKTISSF